MPLSYAALTPDVVLDACDSAGCRADGRLAPLNSYENRVYQVWLEDGGSVVLKFYRPGRWSARQIAEEHAFARELAEHEIPVVAPSFAGEHAGFSFAVYPRRGGRSPELEDRKTLEWIGRFIGRIHAVGASRQFKTRESLTAESFGREPRAWLLEHALIPADLLDAWKAVTEQALASVARCYERAGEVRSIRLHGDCHAGNILWTESGPHFVDLDDARMGPALQDLWMLLSGERRAPTPGESRSRGASAQGLRAPPGPRCNEEWRARRFGRAPPGRRTCALLPRNPLRRAARRSRPDRRRDALQKNGCSARKATPRRGDGCFPADRETADAYRAPTASVLPRPAAGPRAV